MVDLAHPRPLLEEMRAHFAAQNWPSADLNRFRMEAGDDDGGDDGDDGDSAGDTDSTAASAEDIKKMQSALRKANKEAETFRLKLKEIEDRDKSETEKLTERTRELEGSLTSAEQRALRLEIALDKGIPKSIASRLQGNTRQEMEADADELLKTLGSNGKKHSSSFDGGAKDGGTAKSGSFLAQALANRGR